MLRMTIDQVALMEALQGRMVRNGLSQAGLARHLDLSPAMVSEMIHMRHGNLTVKMLKRVEDALGLNPSVLRIGDAWTVPVAIPR